jgi:gliding motility-associated lipoprotein GldH
MRKICLIVSLIIICLSCDKQKVYEQFSTIDHQNWSNSAPLHFNVNINDTASAHNIYIIVRNTGQYEYSNLYLFVTTHSPNGNVLRDTTEIMLANEHGKWLGKGSAAAFTLSYAYKEKIRFPVRGIYQFDIEQAMWIKELRHISHLGLRIEKSEQ